MEIRERKKRELIDILVRMGFSAELGEAIAANLRTEKPMNRMIGYLLSAQPRTEEDIVDEMRIHGKKLLRRLQLKNTGRHKWLKRTRYSPCFFYGWKKCLMLTDGEPRHR